MLFSIKPKLQWLSVVIISIVLLNACRKQDMEMNLKEDSLMEQFFKLPDNTNPELVKVADIIKKQNSQSEFLSSFIKKNGLPKWAFTISNTSISDGQYKSGQRSANTHDSLLFFIPIQDINNKEINSYIVCMKADTTYKFRLYKKNELASIIF